MAGYSSLSNVAVRELASTVLFENIVQDIMVIPGKSAEFKYVQDLNAASVSIQRLKMVQDGRQIGAATNGDFFDNAYGSVQSQIFELPLNIVASRPAKIAAVADDVNGGLLLKAQLANVPKQIARVVNASYFASVITGVLQPGVGIDLSTSSGSTFTAIADTDYITTMTAATPAAAYVAFNAAVGNLGNGDTDNGFDIFDLRNTVLYGRSTYLMTLRNNIGGIFANSNIGQEMVSSGSFTAFDTSYRPDMITGYMGELNGALVYNVGSLFTVAEGWLGSLTVADGTIAAATAYTGSLAHLAGILVCGDAVGGGLDLRSEVKVVDAMGGQGWEVQPLARCGWTLFSAKGVQLIADATGLTYGKFVTGTAASGTPTVVTKTAILPPLNRA